MKIAHTGDVHYGPGHLAEVDKCFSFVVDDAIAKQATALVVAGDFTDHELYAHNDALLAACAQLRRASNALPVLLVQGTFSHEPPGTVRLFGEVAGTHPIKVVDRLCQVALAQGAAGMEWIESRGWCFDVLPAGTKAVFTCLPTLNRAELAVNIGAHQVAYRMGSAVHELLSVYAPSCASARAAGVPSILVSHGTVNGCTTEHGVMMAGADHEFSVDALFAGGFDSVMLGHIHLQQTWVRDGQLAAYCGSPSTLFFGERGTKCYLLWDFTTTAKPMIEVVPTPARTMHDVIFDGVPDLEHLQAISPSLAGECVRVRYRVDEEDAPLVDLARIRAVLHACSRIKIVGEIVRLHRSRGETLAGATTLAAELERWCAATTVDPTPLLPALDALLALGADHALNKIIEAKHHAPN